MTSIINKAYYRPADATETSPTGFKTEVLDKNYGEVNEESTNEPIPVRLLMLTRAFEPFWNRPYEARIILRIFCFWLSKPDYEGDYAYEHVCLSGCPFCSHGVVHTEKIARLAVPQMFEPDIDGSQEQQHVLDVLEIVFQY